MDLEGSPPGVRVMELGRGLPTNLSRFVHVPESLRVISEMQEHCHSHCLRIKRNVETNCMIKALPIPCHGDEMKLPIPPICCEWARNLSLAYSAMRFMSCVGTVGVAI